MKTITISVVAMVTLLTFSVAGAQDPGTVRSAGTDLLAGLVGDMVRFERGITIWKQKSCMATAKWRGPAKRSRLEKTKKPSSSGSPGWMKWRRRWTRRPICEKRLATG